MSGTRQKEYGQLGSKEDRLDAFSIPISIGDAYYYRMLLNSAKGCRIHDEIKKTEHERLYSSLTTEQKGIYDTIMNSIKTRTGGVYFVYGYGGTGKTFLWKTLVAGIRGQGDIVIDETSTSSISAQSDLEALLKNPFENMTLVFGGNFRQVLPVIPKGSRQDIVSASLKQSYLWDHCKVLKLTKNMRLTVGAWPEDVTNFHEFTEWILKVEDGELGEENDSEVEINVPEEIIIDHVDDTVASIVDFTYLNILDNIHDPSYFKEKAVLAPANEVVDNINEHLLDKFLGEELTYLEL
nr:ATP-dependent DNA helicase pfh1-like [Tanacetum cinerariifolium]